jgi:hypothetical protein
MQKTLVFQGKTRCFFDGPLFIAIDRRERRMRSARKGLCISRDRKGFAHHFGLQTWKKCLAEIEKALSMTRNLCEVVESRDLRSSLVKKVC